MPNNEFRQKRSAEFQQFSCVGLSWYIINSVELGGKGWWSNFFFSLEFVTNGVKEWNQIF